MTYREMQQAEAEFKAALAPAKKQRGATRAQLEYRKRFGRCVACGYLLSTHTVEQMGDCATARS